MVCLLCKFTFTVIKTTPCCEQNSLNISSRLHVLIRWQSVFHCVLITSPSIFPMIHYTPLCVSRDFLEVFTIVFVLTSNHPQEQMLVHVFVTSLAKEVMFLVTLVSLSACLFVCGQQYSKSYERIGMKFYGQVLSSTRKN